MAQCRASLKIGVQGWHRKHVESEVTVMNSHERANLQELAGLSEEKTDRVVQQLAAEKEAQVKAAMAVLKRLAFIAAIIAFSLCFCGYPSIRPDSSKP